MTAKATSEFRWHNSRNSRLGRNSRVESSAARAEAGKVPPSKTESSPTVEPARSMTRTCSRPFSAILKSLMVPDCTTNRPSHGSPSLTRISSFRCRRTTQWLARFFNSSNGNTAKNETRRRVSTGSRAGIVIILSSAGMARGSTSIVGIAEAQEHQLIKTSPERHDLSHRAAPGDHVCSYLRGLTSIGETDGPSGGSFMAYIIAEPCINTKDTACVDVCPVDCIHPRKDEANFAELPMLYIDPVECIDCGACVPVCPVSAIFPLDDLPDKWKSFTEVNAQYYQK